MSVVVHEVSPSIEPLRGRSGSAAIRVGLVGFGRTGREVAAAVLRDDQASLVWVLRRSTQHTGRSAAELLGVAAESPAVIRSAQDSPARALLDDQPVDVIIDFGSEDALATYGPAAADLAVPVVSAVSHYSDAAHRTLRRMSARTAVLWSPNITLGVNFLLMAAEALRRIAPEADVQVVEEHFAAKSGPSGTALRIVETLGLPSSALHSIRAGGIVGVHETLFGFPSQCVRIRHESLSREAFGEGALFAARGLVGREPGLYRMEDLLLPYFRQHEAVDRDEQRPGRARARLAGRLRRWAAALD